MKLSYFDPSAAVRAKLTLVQLEIILSVVDDQNVNLMWSPTPSHTCHYDL